MNAKLLLLHTFSTVSEIYIYNYAKQDQKKATETSDQGDSHLLFDT